LNGLARLNWYAVQMDGDPETGNVFGREALRLKPHPLLMAWLQAGGRLTDFVANKKLDGRLSHGGD
jgi:hypothetical protein